jgi:hypothetical protein
MPDPDPVMMATLPFRVDMIAPFDGADTPARLR